MPLLLLDGHQARQQLLPFPLCSLARPDFRTQDLIGVGQCRGPFLHPLFQRIVGAVESLLSLFAYGNVTIGFEH